MAVPTPSVGQELSHELRNERSTETMEKVIAQRELPVFKKGTKGKPTSESSPSSMKSRKISKISKTGKSTPTISPEPMPSPQPNVAKGGSPQPKPTVP
eukprot:CAMPEP_0198294596 /NCGR_PEP_ID=MMETSP1449-20131203/23205_1 /TAXON_ID=420275 /ORGANISM="Attheya septentrionalis, Strain CCMP2084" /LENGTH=97 /DNA_ID=CAMNT_0043994589 /DNA_START=99 /DNA_END=392 /DNA_ORIENTATION=+